MRPSCRVIRPRNQAESSQGHAQRGPARRGQQFQHGADADQRQGVETQIHFQAQFGNDPARSRVAQAGADDDADRLGKRNQARTDESDQGDRRGGRRLNQGGDQGAGNEGFGGGAREPYQGPPQGAAGKGHESVGQQHHADQKQSDAAGKRKKDIQHVRVTRALDGPGEFNTGCMGGYPPCRQDGPCGPDCLDAVDMDAWSMQGR